MNSVIVLGSPELAFVESGVDVSDGQRCSPSKAASPSPLATSKFYIGENILLQVTRRILIELFYLFLETRSLSKLFVGRFNLVYAARDEGIANG